VFLNLPDVPGLGIEINEGLVTSAQRDL